MLPERAISVHFPKAAGTALWKQLASALGDDFVAVWDQNPMVVGAVEPKPLPEGKRLVHGHFHAQTYRHEDAYMFTFLRHPVTSVISTYYFWKTWPNREQVAILDRFHAEKPSVESFAAYEGIRTLMSKVYFGGFDMQRFNFIGFYERRADDFRRLSRDLEIHLDPSIRENETAFYEERREAEENARLRSALFDILADDIRFYEAMLAARS